MVKQAKYTDQNVTFQQCDRVSRHGLMHAQTTEKEQFSGNSQRTTYNLDT